MRWGISTLIRSGLVVASLLSALPARAADDAPPRSETRRAESDDEIRRRLFLENTKGRLGAGVLNVFPAVYGSLFLAGAVAFAVDPGHATPTQTSIFVTTSGVVSAAAFGSYFAPKPARFPILTTLGPLWFSGFAFTLYCDPSGSRQEKQVLGIAAGTGLAAAMIPMLDALSEPPFDPWALQRDRKALETADPTTLHSHVVRAERNLARTTRPLRLVSPIVYLAGVTGMTIAAMRAPQSQDATRMAAAFGIIYSSLATPQLIVALLPSAGQNYERALRNVRLVPIGPQGSAGLTALWRF